MDGLWDMYAGAAKCLEDVGRNYWDRSHFKGWGYDILTTNIAKSINALMKKPRKFPITQSVDYFKLTMQQWFYDRKKTVESITTCLTTSAQKIYDSRKNIATKMHVFNVSDHQFQAKKCGIKEGFVDIRRYTVVENFK